MDTDMSQLESVQGELIEIEHEISDVAHKLNSL